MYSIFQKIRTAGLLAISAGIGAFASAQTYSFTHFTAPYASISGGVELDMQPLCADELSPLIPIGFDFPYYDLTLDSVNVHNAFLLRETSVNGTLEGAQLFPLWVMYECFGATTISYTTTGTAGNRIFTVQWSELGAYTASGPDEYVDMQALFYETDGAIEFRFGHANLPAGAYLDEQTGGVTGLVRYTDYQGNTFVDVNSIALTDSASNPVSASFDVNADVNSMIGTPDSAMVYRFAPSGAGLTETTAAFSINPNPATASLTLTSATAIPEGKTIRIFAANGQCVLETTALAGAQQVIDVSALKDGLYFFGIDGQTGKQRFVKQ